MVRIRVVFLLLAVLLAVGGAAASAETLGEARVGFSAERVLVFDGRRFVGHMWQMPGEQRHEQDLPAIPSAFILHDGDSIADLVLPKLHTVIEFRLPAALAALHRPDLLRRPVGHERIGGLMTTKYAVDETMPDGRANGFLWLSADGIPVRCDGSFRAKNGRVTKVHWELYHIRIGPQPAALFEVPRGYSKLPPEAAATLLGLRLARPGRH
jgi:hypothetical protein